MKYELLIIFPLFILSAQAGGKFSVLEQPNSLEFKGNEKLQSSYIGDVLSAALGLYVDTESKWGGLYINNPFELPRAVVNVMIDGITEIHLNQKTRSFSIFGDETKASINAFLNTAEAIQNSPILNIDLNKGFDSLFAYTNILGDLQIPTTIKSTSNLKPDTYSEDKLFLQQIAAINILSEKIAHLDHKPTLININLSLRPLIEVHGGNSVAITEILKTLTEAVVNFGEKSNEAYNNQLLYTVITDDSEHASPIIRRKRDIQDDSTKDLNLAVYYNEDYPVIFNIILWFMVVFVFSLIAISYVIGTMDPGRDSIIYRMTSTRMKKDN